MEDRLYSAVHEKPYNHLEEEAYLQEKDPAFFREMKEKASALPAEMVREYGMDCALYFLEREKAEGGRKAEMTDQDEDAICGIFRFLGRAYRTFKAGEREGLEEERLEEAGEEARGERFYALCAQAFRALESGRLHLYEAALSKALPFIGKRGCGKAERELYLLLLRESAPCLAGHLLDLEDFSSIEGRERIKGLLEQGKAGSEAVIQVMGRVRGRLLVRPGEDMPEVRQRGERILREAGLDVREYQAMYVPGRVLSFWK